MVNPRRLYQMIPQKWRRPVLLSLLAAVLLLFLSENSPLYPGNEWVDLNCFLTVGRSWTHGIVPYRDLFEQKGPLLYAIFALASLFGKGYFGVYVMEVISMSFSLVLTDRIGRRYLTPQRSLVLTTAAGVLYTITPFFRTGGSAEEFMFPAILWLLWLIVRFDDQAGRFTQNQILSIGAVAAYLFWVKYTSVGFVIGLGLVLLSVYAWRRQWQQLRQLILAGLVGFGAVTLPLLLYFWAVNGLRALFHVYFVVNIKYYPAPAAGILFAQPLLAMRTFLNGMATHWFILSLLLASPIIALLDRRLFQTQFTRALYLGSYLGLIIFTYWGGLPLNYYALILLPLAMMTLVSVIRWVPGTYTAGQSYGIMLFIVLFALGSGYGPTRSRLFPRNLAVDLHLKKTETAQAEFGRIIRRSHDRSLLNYGTLDLGVYEAAGVRPSNYFFIKTNIKPDIFPAMMAEQNRLVANKEPHFVVTDTRMHDTDLWVSTLVRKNYRLVLKRDMYVMESPRSLYLYERK